MSERMDGTVKWWNSDKGFGFIVSEGLNRDVFIHRSQLVKSGYQELEENEQVTFTLNSGKKGMFATEIVRNR